MKCKVVEVQSEPVFKPFAIQIEFETEDEVARFYSLFNQAVLVRATVKEFVANAVRDSIKHGLGGKFQPAGASDYHNILCEVIK